MTETADNTQSKAYLEQLSKLAGFLRQQRQPYEALMQDVCGMFAPELRHSGVQDGMAFGGDLFDGYPQLALKTYSEGIPGNMVYRDSKWLTMRLNIRQLAELPEVKEYCEEQSKIVFWGARRSNFYAVQPELVRHGAVMGGYLFPRRNEKKAAVEFVLSDPWQTWVCRDGMGQVSMAMRQVKDTLSGLAATFGENNLPAEWRRTLTGEQGRPYDRRTLLHLMFENPQYVAMSGNLVERRWASVYLAETEKHIVENKTVDYGPISLGFRVPAGWDYPATPAMYAYVDALTDDVLTETLVKAARLAADPPMRVLARLRGSSNFDIGYGGITWVQRPEDIIEQVKKMGQWPVGDAERDRVRAGLDRWFSVPFFEMISRSLSEGTPPTAYHMRLAQAEKATLLGPEVGYYTHDCLDPSVDMILAEEPELTGDVVERPAVLDDFLRQRVEIGLGRLNLPATEENVNAYIAKHPLASTEAVYNGLLTSIESEMVQNRSYFDGIGLIQAAASIWPEAPLVGKPDIVLRHALEAMSWTEDDLRTKDDYKQAVESWAQSQQLQQQADLMKNLAVSSHQSAQAAQIERT